MSASGGLSACHQPHTDAYAYTDAYTHPHTYTDAYAYTDADTGSWS